MKKVVALKNYTDPYYIFREGMIYNLEDSVANKFVALGVMTEGTPDDVVITSASTSGTQIADIKINGQSNKIYAPAGGGEGGGVLVIENNGGTLNKTLGEIRAAAFAVLITSNGTSSKVWSPLVEIKPVEGQDIFSVTFKELIVGGTITFYAENDSDFPEED